MTTKHVLWIILGVALFVGTVVTDVSLWLRGLCALGLGLWGSLSLMRIGMRWWMHARVAYLRWRVNRMLTAESDGRTARRQRVDGGWR